jgi:class 3 adenylate cyclase
MEIRERRLAIVLLDLIGSTKFVQKVGPMKAARWLQYHDRLTRSLMHRFNGREIDRSDGFLLSFESPINAVNFALLYQRDIPPKTKLNTRIGLHVGIVAEVTQDELDVLVGAKPVELEGVAKSIAARTMSLCQAGQVLLTEEAFKHIKGRVNGYTPKGTRYFALVFTASRVSENLRRSTPWGSRLSLCSHHQAVRKLSAWEGLRRSRAEPATDALKSGSGGS